MRILTVYFGSKYKRHLKVFEASAKEHMPKAKLEVLKLPDQPKNIDRKIQICYAFTETVKHILKKKQDYIVCDTDLMFTGSIEDIEIKEFDIAVTTRETIPYNTGLWAIRYNERSEKFLHRWIENTEVIKNLFIKHDEEMLYFIHKHGGIDQASLAATLSTMNDAVIEYLPCQEWNACQHEWELADKNTKVIHIKSSLRKFCFGQMDCPEPEYMKPLIAKWRKYNGYS